MTGACAVLFCPVAQKELKLIHLPCAYQLLLALGNRTQLDFVRNNAAFWILQMQFQCEACQMAYQWGWQLLASLFNLQLKLAARSYQARGRRLTIHSASSESKPCPNQKCGIPKIFLHRCTGCHAFRPIHVADKFPLQLVASNVAQSGVLICFVLFCNVLYAFYCFLLCPINWQSARCRGDRDVLELLRSVLAGNRSLTCTF